MTESETGHDVSSDRQGIKPLHMATPTSGRCIVFMLEVSIESHPTRMCDMRHGSESVTSPTLLWSKEDDMFSLNAESSMQRVSNIESHKSVRVDSALDNGIFPIVFSQAKCCKSRHTDIDWHCELTCRLVKAQRICSGGEMVMWRHDG